MQLAAARVGRHRHEPARLQRGRRLARIAKALPDHDGRTRQRRLGVADAHGDGRDVVAFGRGEQAWRRRRQGGRHRRARRQRLVSDVDQLQRVARDVRVIRHDQRHRLADVAHDAAGDGGLQVAIRARRGGHAVGDHGAGGDVGRGEDTGQLARALRVDAGESRVRVRRAEHRRVQHARHADVFDEAPGAGDQPLAAEPPVTLADHSTFCAAAASTSTK